MTNCSMIMLLSDTLVAWEYSSGGLLLFYNASFAYHSENNFQVALSAFLSTTNHS